MVVSGTTLTSNWSQSSSARVEGWNSWHSMMACLSASPRDVKSRECITALSSRRTTSTYVNIIVFSALAIGSIRPSCACDARCSMFRGETRISVRPVFHKMKRGYRVGMVVRIPYIRLTMLLVMSSLLGMDCRLFQNGNLDESRRCFALCCAGSCVLQLEPYCYQACSGPTHER